MNSFIALVKKDDAQALFHNVMGQLYDTIELQIRVPHSPSHISSSPIVRTYSLTKPSMKSQWKQRPDLRRNRLEVNFPRRAIYFPPGRNPFVVLPTHYPEFVAEAKVFPRSLCVQHIGDIIERIDSCPCRGSPTGHDSSGRFVG